MTTAMPRAWRAPSIPVACKISTGKIVTHDGSVSEPPREERRPFGFEQIADCGSMRVVGLRLEAGQKVPEHRNAIPVALIVTEGRLHFDDGTRSGDVGAGEMLLINPGERHVYRADIDTSAYLVFAGLPGVRSRTWTLRSKV